MKSNSSELKCVFLKCMCLDSMRAQEVRVDKQHFRGFCFSTRLLLDNVQNLRATELAMRIPTGLGAP
jgi:hypothetical protein